MKYNGLDVYDITLDNLDIGIKATSLVTLPATDSAFLHFNKDKAQFAFSDDEKQELVGAIMIPDKFIFRNINGHKFYVNFTKEIISELVGKMIKDGTGGLFSVQHQDLLLSDEIDVKEIWIKESETDKSVALDIDEPIGTAFMKVRVNDEVIWNQVKENGLNGFSIELDASIIEKNELLFKQEIKKMKITDVFSNAIEVNGVKLHFNSELGQNTYLVTESDDNKPVAYTGEFNYENVVYKVKDGVVFEAVDVELSTKEAIESLLTEFTSVKDSVTAIMTSKTALEEAEAELELLKTQFEADKTAFADLKAKGISTIETNMSKSISDAGTSSKEWLKKF